MKFPEKQPFRNEGIETTTSNHTMLLW